MVSFRYQQACRTLAPSTHRIL